MELLELYQLEVRENFAMLPKCELIEGYNPRDFYNLTLVKVQRNGFSDFVITGVNSLLLLQGVSTSNSESKSEMNKSLSRLCDNGYIEMYKDMRLSEVDKILPTNNYLIKTTAKSDKNTENGKEMFSKVFFSDIQKIMRANYNYKHKLFAVYHCIIGCVNYDRIDEDGQIIAQQSDRMAYPSINVIAERVDLDRKTVMRCLEILEENHVLYTLTRKVNEKRDRNFYCRWMYKDFMQSWVNNHLTNSNKKD